MILTAIESKVSIKCNMCLCRVLIKKELQVGLFEWDGTLIERSTLPEFQILQNNK